jgi:hypothetical protein
MVPFHNLRREAQVIMGVLSGHRPSKPDEALSKCTGLSDAIWSIMEQCWSESLTSRLSASAVVVLLRDIPSSVV